jgi:hypothetical protein
MVEKLREITEGNPDDDNDNGLGWKFFYGRRDFQNLVETESENDAKYYFYLDPVTRDKLYSKAGLPLGETEYEGRFMLLTNSDLDQEYDAQTDERTNEEGKWLTHIKPKLEKVYGDFESKLVCEDIEIKRMQSTDVINMFDGNMDGILVNFKFKIYE